MEKMGLGFRVSEVRLLATEGLGLTGFAPFTHYWVAVKDLKLSYHNGYIYSK